MSDYYDQTPEQRRQLRAQRNRRRQAQVRRRKLLLGLLVLAVLAVVLILVLRGCGKDKEPGSFWTMASRMASIGRSSIAIAQISNHPFSFRCLAKEVSMLPQNSS